LLDGQQRGWRRSLEIGLYSLLDKTAHAALLLATGLSYGPETLTPLLSFASSGALGDSPIDDTKA